MELLFDCLRFLRDHGSKVILVITWVGIALVWRKRRASWFRKEFMNQVNFSLNHIADGALTIRTLLETTAQKVCLNEWGAKLLINAASKTTETDPFVRLSDQGDRDFIHRAVLNTLSERFAETFVAAALGVPVKTSRFFFAITCEKYEDMRTRKIRVLLIAESTLKRFGPGCESDELRVAAPKLSDRIRTLQAMYAENKADTQVLSHLELGIVT